MKFDTGFSVAGEPVILSINAGEYIPDDLADLTVSVFLDTSRISQLMEGYSTQYVYLVMATYLAAYKKATGIDLAMIFTESEKHSSGFPLEPMEECPEC